MNPWVLPTTAEIGGKEYNLNADFRDVLEIIGWLNDNTEPEFIRWAVALALFYDGEIPDEDAAEAMEYLVHFINCGKTEPATSAPRLMDWGHDSLPIISDVNRVAGCEIRSLPFLHWWTFISYFSAIGEGQLSSLVSIRDKLRRREKLDKWEQRYYLENQSRIDLPEVKMPETPSEQDWLAQLGIKP